MSAGTPVPIPVGTIERSGLVVAMAAAFRLAHIIAKDLDTATFRNTHAIKEAEEFINACETAGLIKVEKEV